MSAAEHRYSEDLQDKDNKVHTYTSDWDIYAIAFSSKPQYKFRLALGSFIEEEQNKVKVIQLNQERGQFQPKFEFEHKFPPSKIMWIPDVDNAHPDLCVTSGETLNIWTVEDNEKATLTSS
jgi:WD repeat-containing protein 68